MLIDVDGCDEHRNYSEMYVGFTEFTTLKNLMNLKNFASSIGKGPKFFSYPKLLIEAVDFLELIQFT